jgi:asparagine synthase (glutamine-hydrolysing)
VFFPVVESIEERRLKVGGFLLFLTDQNSSAEDIERQYQSSIEVFKKKGLELKRRIANQDFIVFVFDKYSLKAEDVYESEDGGFIVSVGTSLYKGKVGSQALRALHEDFSNGKDFHDDLYGHFCLLIFDKGKLFIFTDYAGLYKVYCNQSKSVISSSFLAVAKSVAEKSVSSQELYEYVFHEAFYGGKTLFKEIELLDSKRLWQISPKISYSTQKTALRDFENANSFDEAVNLVAGDLEDYFRLLQSAFDNKIASSLSSGYDTRLMLALIRKVGISPYFFVYGDRDSVDVRIATEIAQGEKFELDHIDKGKYPEMGKEFFYKTTQKNYFLFDGFGAMGAFDDGSDIDTRIDRANRAQLHLNAGGGELFRRTWQFSDDKKVEIEGFLSNKYGHLYMLNDFIDYRICGERFDRQTYLSTFRDKIKSLLDIDRDWLTRGELEVLYSHLSVKYWLGMNNSIDNQFSYSLTPFAETRFILQSLNIPSEYKSYGQFEAALIKNIAPDLAKYPSQYGFNFYDGISHRERLKESIKETCKSSFLLRPLMPFIQNALKAKKHKMPYFLHQDYLKEIFNHRDLNICQYIELDRVTDPAILSRALTLELIMEDIF